MSQPARNPRKSRRARTSGQITAAERLWQPTSPWWALAGAAILLLAWQWGSTKLGPMLMATPWQSLQALWRMAATEAFAQHAGISLLRIATGVGGACLIGITLGIAAGSLLWLRGLLEPLRWLLMAVPSVVVVVLAMLWFGLGTQMVVFIAMLMLSPGLYVNTVKGMRMVDAQLLEMSDVYGFTRGQRIVHLLLPTLAAPLAAAVLIACCGGVRLVVMAELLGAENGIGWALANARTTFDTGELYGWVILLLALVAVIEFCLLQPLQRRMLRWQEVHHA